MPNNAFLSIYINTHRIRWQRPTRDGGDQAWSVGQPCRAMIPHLERDVLAPCVKPAVAAAAAGPHPTTRWLLCAQVLWHSSEPINTAVAQRMAVLRGQQGPYGCGCGAGDLQSSGVADIGKSVVRSQLRWLASQQGVHSFQLGLHVWQPPFPLPFPTPGGKRTMLCKGSCGTTSARPFDQVPFGQGWHVFGADEGAPYPAKQHMPFRYFL